MTLADLCTSLIERESVIHSFRNTASREAVRAAITQARITKAADALKTFTRRELAEASGCSPGSVHNWEKVNKGRLVEVGRVVSNRGVAVIWRWSNG